MIYGRRQVLDLRPGTEFAVNGKKLRLVRRTECSAFVQTVGSGPARVEFWAKVKDKVAAEGDVETKAVSFGTTPTHGYHIGPTTEID